MTLKRPYLKALLGGLTIGIVPAWAVSFLAKAFPSLKPEELEIVSEFMANGIGPIQIIFFMLIVFVVPAMEELFFRGWLWKLCEWKISPYYTWITISILFASIHMEPLHVLGLLPFSFFVGWLRYRTGGIGPSTVAHMANNGVGCLLMVL